MKIFISWSGERSKAIALFLKKWIHDVIQAVDPWMSELDVHAGERWGQAIDNALNETRFAIICLTKKNLNEPWILFEAGASAKAVEDSAEKPYVCPYLIDLKQAEIPSGPLTSFQSKEATMKGTWGLLWSINIAGPTQLLSEEALKRQFEKWWPDLDKELKSLTAEESPETKRTADDMIEEILLLARKIDQAMNSESLSSKENYFIDRMRAGLLASTSNDLSAALNRFSYGCNNNMGIASPSTNMGIAPPSTGLWTSTPGSSGMVPSIGKKDK
ncbi:MAG: toll/interleukin-1 receptor domain-containing protein [Proteobacteria bacterium]|nr:toll/interleukin-1 receptor domain-containing protein [Pseudomonadota bacterium]